MVIAIGVIGAVCFALCFFLAGFALSQRQELEQMRIENKTLTEDNATLRSEIGAHETSLSMLLGEMETSS